MRLTTIRTQNQIISRSRVVSCGRPTQRIAVLSTNPYREQNCHPVSYSRFCSSRSWDTTGKAWKVLNRVPTPSCLSPDSIVAKNARESFFPEIEALYRGNHRFRDTIAATAPNLLKDLAAQGQKPPFMLLDCSDSRVGEQVIFSVEPGTLFTTGNIANQFHEHDLNSKSVLSYAVDVLKVKHVIVMGHYGCGGVAAAILPPSSPGGQLGHHVDNPVQDWIQPIRAIYLTSQRPEIVEHRERKVLEKAREDIKEGEQGLLQGSGNGSLPHLHDPAFRALVQENVKANVLRIARSITISNHYASLADREASEGVFIHGWVYDIETGEVGDLDVSVGPPGRSIPITPFPVIGDLSG